MYFPLFVNPETRQVAVASSEEYSVEIYPRKANGEDGRWEWGPETAAARTALLEGVWISSRREWDIFQREYLSDEDGQIRTTKWKSIWNESALNHQNGKSELGELFERVPFDYTKPLALLTKKDSL